MPRLRTVAFATVIGVSASLVLAAPASAHVSVSSTNAVQGGYAVVTFRMPNEEAKATTTKLQVQLPTATPFASASVQPVPGWTAVATKTKLAKPITTDDGPVTEAVTQITWTAATAAAVKPGEFQLFNVLVGPLPEQSTVTFKALQTYSNGDVVRWVETAAPGSSAEPEHPAPVLTLAPAGQSSSQPTSQPTSGASATVASAAAASDDGGSSNTGPIVLSIVALVLAAGAIGLGVVNRARRHG